MSQQIKTNIINSVIGLLIGMPLFILTASYATYLVVLPLILVFALMKYIERRIIKDHTSTQLILPLVWIVSSLYLLYVLYQDSFLEGDRIITANMILLIIFLALVPIAIQMSNKGEYKSKALNILSPCIIWSIIVFVIYKLDIAQNEFLSGMSIVLMIFPFIILLFNLVYERTIMHLESRKK